jgi:8-amino-7-oxononanoate synthase
MYENELAALKKAGRYRDRKIFSRDLIDLASNDYLRLAGDETLFNRAIKRLQKNGVYGAKASQLVNGYSPIHRDFERALIKTYGFQSALVVGSGFLGNLALFETLPRKGDLLIIDEEYHASGMLASKLARSRVIFFAHNDAEDLRRKLKQNGKANRVFVAVEGVYSMSGRRVKKEVLLTVKASGATLIIDEAHSGGTIGARLLGALDCYGLDAENTVRLGTLGKAYGSYGAYILASEETIDFLVNRAKSVIYSTAPSLFDIAYAREALKLINARRVSIGEAIDKARAIAARRGYETESLILPIATISDKRTIAIQKALLSEGFLVGAIRRPTVKTPQLRVILREKAALLERFFSALQNVMERV